MAAIKKIKRLSTPDPKRVDALKAALDCHPVTASLLAGRGILCPEDAERFLRPSLSHLRPPFAIRDLKRAADRICRAVINRENLLIFGDYDVDGVTATTLLLEFLKRLGAVVSYYIPHRLMDGYGLKPEHIQEIAIPKHINVLVTVDCGSSSHEAVATAQAAGIDVIITDHHEPPAKLPPALAVVNPKRADCAAGFQDLAGVGVAFCLMIAIRKHFRESGRWRHHEVPNLKKSCDLIALGTVADMVPLTRDNRILTKTGLQILQSTPRCGLEALMKCAGIQKKILDSEDLAFRLAPRLNAAGRIQHAKIAARLLMTTDAGEAQKTAERLNELNALRQREEKRVFDDIVNFLNKNQNVMESKCLVLAGTGWHEGILGIVASRITQRYGKPAVVIALDNEIGKGSGRSVSGFNLFEAISACADLVLQFGGHAMAAGLQIEKANIELFRKRLVKVCIDRTGPDDFTPEMHIDYELDLDVVTPGLADEIEQFKPFGTRNPEPLFLARNVRVLSSSSVGGFHRRMMLAPAQGNARLPAIQFNAGPSAAERTFFSQLVYKLQWNRWNGNKKLQLIVEDID